jgi:hypothetical protein
MDANSLVWLEQLTVWERTAERVAVTLAGVLSIYLGYRLTLRRVTGCSDLEVKHNRTKLKLLKAAPGILFAILGASILISVALAPVTISWTFRDGLVSEVEIHQHSLEGWDSPS